MVRSRARRGATLSATAALAAATITGLAWPAQAGATPDTRTAAVQHSAVQRSTVQRSTVQRSAVRHAATHFTRYGPVGSGTWTSDSPTYSVQQCAGGVASGSTFTLPTSPTGGGSSGACSNGKMRAERRYENYANDGQNYSDGVRQFEGTFTINSMSGTNICLKQTFNGSAGPYILIAVNSKRDLYVVGRSTTIAHGIAKNGVPVQINTVHDTNAGVYQIYVNGTLVYEDDNAPGGDFYDKLGAYQTASGSGAISVTWSNIHFWYQ